MLVLIPGIGVSVVLIGLRCDQGIRHIHRAPDDDGISCRHDLAQIGQRGARGVDGRDVKIFFLDVLLGGVHNSSRKYAGSAFCVGITCVLVSKIVAVFQIIFGNFCFLKVTSKGIQSDCKSNGFAAGGKLGILQNLGNIEDHLAVGEI